MAIDPNIKKKANDIRTKIKGKEVREALASGIEDISEDVVQNEGRQSNVEQRQSVVEDRQTDVESRFDDQIAGNTDIDEVIDARSPEGGEAYPTLRKRLDAEHQEVTTQLADKPNLQVFHEVPSANQLLEGNLGLVLIPTFPFYYDFSGADGGPWDVYEFVTKKHSTGTMFNNQPEIKDDKGILRVRKEAGVTSHETLEQRLLHKLDFQKAGGYKIRVDMMYDTSNDTARGNTGITITPTEGNLSNFPLPTFMENGYSVFLSGSSAHDDMFLRIRKIVGGVQVFDEYAATHGGTAQTTEQRLRLPANEMVRVELSVSPTHVNLKVNGDLILNREESMSWLDVTYANLVLWGGNADLNTEETVSVFDNLVVTEE